jgi:hypothetical protein
MGFEIPIVPPTDYGEHQADMVVYLRAGAERAQALGNRGPLRFTSDGALHPDIVEAYGRCGFYIFDGLLAADELADLEADVVDMWDRAPVRKGGDVDANGRPALANGCKGVTLSWVRPLSDPVGGTEHSHGRHPAKMIEPDAPKEAPEHVLQIVLGSLQFSDACLRLYGHPDLLRVAAAIHGEDFAPFNESVWLKYPRLGGSVAWHQDAFTHWDSADLGDNTHGFNFMAQLYGCTPANGLWVVPGSHHAKADIRSMVETAGSDRLPDAVPFICEPGDVAICNRQAVHGSFANTSDDARVTINFGFHPRKSVLGVRGGGIHNDVEIYTAERIQHRSRLIAYAIDARGQRYPDEASFQYLPLADAAGRFRWDNRARADIRDYNLQDLGI